MKPSFRTKERPDGTRYRYPVIPQQGGYVPLDLEVRRIAPVAVNPLARTLELRYGGIYYPDPTRRLPKVHRLKSQIRLRLKDLGLYPEQSYDNIDGFTVRKGLRNGREDILEWYFDIDDLRYNRNTQQKFMNIIREEM